MKMEAECRNHGGKNRLDETGGDIDSNRGVGGLYIGGGMNRLIPLLRAVLHLFPERFVCAGALERAQVDATMLLQESAEHFQEALVLLADGQLCDQGGGGRRVHQTVDDWLKQRAPESDLGSTAREPWWS